MSDAETPQARILIVEDELDLLELMVFSIQRMGHIPFPIDKGDEAITLLTQESFDLLLLDVMLPSLSGQEICKFVRSYSDIPIIVVSALGRTETVVEMLELGADEYITKPFSFQAFEAQVGAQLRRIEWSTTPPVRPVIQVGDIKLDTKRQIATIEKKRIHLSERECSVLHHLIQNYGSPITSDQLCEAVWGIRPKSKSTTLVQTTIQRLRSKIETNPSKPEWIVTVRGYGYKIESPLE
ncbi:MAG: response regulator transcription factor [Chloroflexota bacterium]